MKRVIKLVSNVFLLLLTLTTISGCAGQYSQVEDRRGEVEMLRQKAEEGDAESQALLGLIYYDGEYAPQNYAEALKWYRKGAEQGGAYGANCQFFIGSMYHEGKGVSQDYVEAEKWYIKAAEQGEARGQMALGLMYRNGEGVEKDYAEAAKWFRKSAEQGNYIAQINLGQIIYLSGNGLEKNNVQAYMWIILGGENMHIEGMNDFRRVLRILEDKMTPEQIVEAQRLASEWKKKHPKK